MTTENVIPMKEMQEKTEWNSRSDEDRVDKATTSDEKNKQKRVE